ncbi:MAG: hypothetical protein ABFS45_24535 [Pseudomonadota bacterium]
MINKRVIAAMLLAIGVQSAGSTEIAAEWTFIGQITPSYNFRLDLQSTDVAGVFTLNGYSELLLVTGAPREAVVGSATFSPNEDIFAVSLFFNTSTGQNITIGADLDPMTLSGDGEAIRVVSGGVDSSIAGTLAVVPIE